jgi:hypothetical protein
MQSNSYKLVGGWEKTDPDFIEYQENELVPKVNNIGDLNKTLSDELVLTTNEKFGTSFENLEDRISMLGDLIKFIREKSKENPELFIDDYNYNRIKFTIIPKGTMFYRRQTIPTFNNTSHAPVWLDYTGTMATTPFSFLTDTNEIYTQEYLDKVKEKFGDDLLILRPKKDLLIIHFPYYVTSYIECFIRRICVDIQNEACVDGYTMDLLQFNPNKIFKPLPSLTGFRELCVLDARNLEFVALVTPRPVITPPRPVITPPRPASMSPRAPPLLSIKPTAVIKKSKSSSTRSSRSSSKKSKGSSTRSSRSSSKKSKGSSTRSSRSSSKKSKGSSSSKKSKGSSSKKIIDISEYPIPTTYPESPKLRRERSPIVKGRFKLKSVSPDEL